MRSIRRRLIASTAVVLAGLVSGSSLGRAANNVSRTGKIVDPSKGKWYHIESACINCQSNCPPPEPGEYMTGDGSYYALRCYDFDGIPPKHCCDTEIQKKKIWIDPPVGNPELVGLCESPYCPGSTPTTTACS